MPAMHEIEYEIHGLPRPDLVVLLDTPANVSKDLISRKAQRDYTDAAADMQEADTDYLSRVRTAYRELAFERHWAIVPVTESDELRAIEAITADIEALVDQSLARRS